MAAWQVREEEEQEKDKSKKSGMKMKENWETTAYCTKTTFDLRISKSDKVTGWKHDKE